MRWSQTLIPTSKDTPADATMISHQLMLRAGLIRQRAAGLYDLLPLGLRALGKLENLFRTAFVDAGAIEVQFPALQPGSPTPSFQFKDSRGRTLSLTDSAIANACDLAASVIRSHRQLPLTLFHIGPRHSPEDRPRNALLLPREYQSFELFSFNPQSNICNPQPIVDQVLSQLDLATLTLPTSTGSAIYLPHPAGEDLIVTSSDNAYTASLDLAATADRPWTFGGDPVGDLEKVHTPNLHTVADAARHINVTPRDALKNIVFRATPSAEWTGYDTPENLTTPQWVIAVLRGDHELNLHKLTAAVREQFHIQSIEPADESASSEFAFGSVGPDIAMKKVRAVLVIDPDAAQNHPWATGANEPDYHVKNFHWFRECGQSLADPRKTLVTDIRNVTDGDPSPSGPGTLKLTPALRLATITTADVPRSACPTVSYRDDSGASHPTQLTTLHIHLSRLLAAIAKTHHDPAGLRWPAAVAPYSVLLTPIQYTGQTRDVTDRLYADLTAAGLDVLLDDRPDLRPGARFADADLIGIPTRINIGERSLRNGQVEIKRRSSPETTAVDLSSVLTLFT